MPTRQTLKIGIVCPYNIMKDGGVQQHILAQKKELESRGHSVKILTPLPRGWDTTNVHDDVIFIGTSSDFNSLGTTVQVSRADTNEIDEMLAREAFDVLHFHEPWQPDISRQILLRSTSVNVGTFHAKVPETVTSRTLTTTVMPYLKQVLQYIHEITAVSESAADFVSSLTDESITFVPNGIDLAKYTRPVRRKRSTPKTILFIGRLEKRKGVRYLLKAYHLLSQDNDDVKLIIAGDGPERERLELLAEDLKLPNVEFLGYISEALKIKLLRECDLFVSPAIFGESFGIVLAEAMATGAVTVAGNNSGYVDLMQGVGAISVVDPHFTEEFARRLNLLLNEPVLRSAWTAWADGYVQQFAWPKVVDSYEGLYREALQNHA